MPNKVYVASETEISFGSEVGDDVAWSSESITNAAGRQSALYDHGAFSRAFLWHYRFYSQFQATPTVGNTCDLYIKTAGPSNNHPDNDDGVGDAAVSAEDKLRNLHYVNSIVVDEAAANIEMVASGEKAIFAREFACVLWNASGATITTDAAETKALWTPMPFEIQ